LDLLTEVSTVVTSNLTFYGGPWPLYDASACMLLDLLCILCLRYWKLCLSTLH